MPDKAMFAGDKSAQGLLAERQPWLHRVILRQMRADTHMHHRLRFSASHYDIYDREGKTRVLQEAGRLPKNRYLYDMRRCGLAHG